MDVTSRETFTRGVDLEVAKPGPVRVVVNAHRSPTGDLVCDSDVQFRPGHIAVAGTRARVKTVSWADVASGIEKIAASRTVEAVVLAVCHVPDAIVTSLAPLAPVTYWPQDCSYGELRALYSADLAVPPESTALTVMCKAGVKCAAPTLDRAAAAVEPPEERQQRDKPSQHVAASGCSEDVCRLPSSGSKKRIHAHVAQLQAEPEAKRPKGRDECRAELKQLQLSQAGSLDELRERLEKASATGVPPVVGQPRRAKCSVLKSRGVLRYRAYVYVEATHVQGPCRVTEAEAKEDACVLDEAYYFANRGRLDRVERAAARLHA